MLQYPRNRTEEDLKNSGLLQLSNPVINNLAILTISDTAKTTANTNTTRTRLATWDKWTARASATLYLFHLILTKDRSNTA